MLDDQRLHGALINTAGSRERLNTPVLDLDALERNLQKMRRGLQGAGHGCRPAQDPGRRAGGRDVPLMGDEHGLVVDAALQHSWELGEKLTLAVPHCDPTVNLYDAYNVVRGDILVDIWPVTARGRSR